MSDFKIITFDVEHGSSHILVTPNGEYIMIDAGSTSTFSPSKHINVVWGVPQLRWLHITHYDSDHLTDIEEVQALYPRTLHYPDVPMEEVIALYGDNFSSDFESFLKFKRRYTVPALPMDDPIYDWGGVKFAAFNNGIEDLVYPSVNDISSVLFASYQGWTIVFPGDLEKEGWLKLMENDSFNELMSKVDIFIASHHGRESGFCEDIFQVCKPHITIISDKSVSSTSVTGKYYSVTSGLNVRNPLGDMIKRSVLTTRNDGVITVSLDEEGRYKITTSL